MKSVLSSIAFLLSCSAIADDKKHDIPISKLGTEYRLIGKLGVPLGSVVTVQGIVVEGPHKGSEDGPNIRIQRVNGRSTQDDIQIKLDELTIFNHRLPKLVAGKSYELTGYEAGNYG